MPPYFRLIPAINFIKTNNLRNLLGVEFGLTSLFSLTGGISPATEIKPAPLLLAHILMIISTSSKKQMREPWISIKRYSKAGRVIAMMANLKTFWDWSVNHFPRCAVNASFFSVPISRTEAAITAALQSAIWPLNAFGVSQLWHQRHLRD